MVALAHFLRLGPFHTAKDEQRFSVSKGCIEEPVLLPQLSGRKFGRIESIDSSSDDCL